MGLDPSMVQKVLKIAHKLIRKHKTLNTQVLYNVSKKQLQLPRRGLMKILKFMLNEKIIINGSQYTKETVLKSSIRRKIYESIDSNLGVNFTWIKENIYLLDQGNYKSISQFIWHLNLLIKFGYIKKIKVGGKYTIFISHNIDEKFDRICFLLRNPLTLEIIKILISRSQINKQELTKALNEKREKIYYRLRNLSEQQILIKTGKNEQELMINPTYESLIRLSYEKMINS